MAIIITGAAGGLGSAVCDVFQEARVDIVAVDRQWQTPRDYETIAADLTTAEGAAGMIEQALAHGPVDGLIHLVGGFAGGAAIADTLDGKAVNVHFEDHLEGGEIRFDYQLRPGVVTRSNALELMRSVGLDV